MISNNPVSTHTNAVLKPGPFQTRGLNPSTHLFLSIIRIFPYSFFFPFNFPPSLHQEPRGHRDPGLVHRADVCHRSPGPHSADRLLH